MSKWADSADAPEGEETMHTEVIESKSKDGKEVIKVITEIRRNEAGKKVKVTRRVKTVTESKKEKKQVALRRKWVKFGASLGAPVGPERGVTDRAEEVFLEEPDQARDLDANKGAMGGVNVQVVCRKCGGDHWTAKCRAGASTLGTSVDGLGLGEELGGEDAAPGEDGAYRPPGARSQAAGVEEVKPSVRVTNLTEEATEEDLKQLFRKFGPIARVSVPKDRFTGMCRGFAFVDFFDQKDAADAIENMHGKGFANLIINVEWAKPSAGGGGPRPGGDRPGGDRGPPPRDRGYGDRERGGGGGGYGDRGADRGGYGGGDRGGYGDRGGSSSNRFAELSRGSNAYRPPGAR